MSYNLTGAIQGGNIVFANSGISGLSGAVSTYATANTIQASINGKLITPKTAITTTATPTTDVAKTAFNGSSTAFTPLLANQASVFVFTLDASGTVGVAQGPVVAYTDTSANSTPVPLPALPDTVVSFAYAVIKNGATGSSWTFGSGLWNATGIVVDTPVNVSTLPATGPLTA